LVIVGVGAWESLMADTVTIVGVGALAGDLERLAATGGPLDRASSDAAVKLLTPAAATTTAAIPVDTGAMAASVVVKPETLGAALSEGTGVVYAGWVDFGGGHGRPYLPQGRYLYPATADLEGQAEPVFDQAYQAAIDAFAWTNSGTTPGAVSG
jgi:hypothetical protein